MNLKNIILTNNKIKLTDKQAKGLEIADQLIENFNNSVNESFIPNSFQYDGVNLSKDSLGFAHQFLLDDINVVLKGDMNLHNQHIEDTLKGFFEPYNNTFHPKKIDSNLTTLITTIISYYKSNFYMTNPSYLETNDFKNFIRSVEEDALKRLNS